MTSIEMIGPWQVILIIALSLPIIALIDILRSKFRGNNKLIWALAVIFLGLLGVLLYLIIGIKQKINNSKILLN